MLRGEDYTTLTWEETNTLPKPSEQAILAFSSEVDGILLDRRNRTFQQAKFLEIDGMLRCIEVIIAAIDDLQRQAGEGNLAPSSVAAIDTVKSKIASIRTLTK